MNAPRFARPAASSITPGFAGDYRRGPNAGRILLARSTRIGASFYSVLAGFVEPGETLEECVSREIREEVGLRVTDIRYFGSQPWPFRTH